MTGPADTKALLAQIKALSTKIDNHEISDDNLDIRLAKDRESFLVLNGLTDMVVVSDTSGTIRFANPASWPTLGYDPDYLVGKNVDILMADNEQKHSQHIQEYLHSGISQIIGKGREAVAKTSVGHDVPVYLYLGEIKEDKERYFLIVLHVTN